MESHLCEGPVHQARQRPPAVGTQGIASPSINPSGHSVSLGPFLPEELDFHRYLHSDVG
jgi:hypothetical protein